jgi:hypothetical protein
VTQPTEYYVIYPYILKIKKISNIHLSFLLPWVEFI